MIYERPRLSNTGHSPDINNTNKPSVSCEALDLGHGSDAKYDKWRKHEGSGRNNCLDNEILL